ncbi:acyl-homoserine-lactone synthase [Vibrio sp.]|uniref:acyl-homoserine-lactone synthase n=1 Tax=Vibrio sp. TaxID=678 RepID=UPI003D145033
MNCSAPSDIALTDRDQHLSWEALLSLVSSLERLYGADFFEQILNDRINQLRRLFPWSCSGNLATCLQSQYYAKLLGSAVSHWPPEYYLVERYACHYCGNWAEFWCQYLIEKIKQRYPITAKTKSSSTLQSAKFDDSRYQSRLIDNIEQHQSRYISPHHPAEMPVSAAILLANLEVLVKGQKWYEMLFALDLSQTGCHFVLSAHRPEWSKPVIYSSAKIQSGSDINKWLYFSPFFSNDKWHYCSSNQHINLLRKKDILPIHCHFESDSSAKFENDLLKNMRNYQSVCEIIRLTVSGSDKLKLYLLYLSQKCLTAQLLALNYTIAFIITENPFILNYYSTLDPGSFITVCHLNIDGTRQTTCKGLWNIQQLKQDFETHQYKGYIKRVMSVRRSHRGGHEHQYMV